MTETAELIPFPGSRRIGTIRNTARRAVSFENRDSAPAYIARQVDVQRQALLKRGLAPEIVEREMKALTAAIGAYMWRLVMQAGAETA